MTGTQHTRATNCWQTLLFPSGAWTPPLLYGTELTLSSKWCISKFLSKGLFFYYLLNFQTLGGKEARGSQPYPLAVVCYDVVLWLRSCVSYLTGNLSTTKKGRKEGEKWSNLAIFLWLVYITLLKYVICDSIPFLEGQWSKMVSKKCHSFRIISTSRIRFSLGFYEI